MSRALSARPRHRERLVDDAVIHINLADQTHRVLATLSPRDEKVLRLRFGIGESALEEVGEAAPSRASASAS